jgi:multiple sugar transport system ATP-binding protein
VAEIVLDDVGKVYSDGTRAVDSLSLHVADGEFVVLVGPSGCGKTTALRMIAGWEDVTEGRVRIGERVVNDVPSRERDVAMVFQSRAPYPHLDVFDKAAFGLRLRRFNGCEVGRRTGTVAATLGLKEYLGSRPMALSGGQRERVAVGRGVRREPTAFLMDEPLSNLDARLRTRMRTEIARNSRRLGVTTVYVTDDQTEAMTLGDRVAVLKRGVLQQIGTPKELYERPANLFVAGFLGSPPMNLVRGVFTRAMGRLSVLLGGQLLPVDPVLLRNRPGLAQYLECPVVIGVRPEDMQDANVGWSSSSAVLRAEVDLTEMLGSDLLAHFRIPAPGAVHDDGWEPATQATAPLVNPDDVLDRDDRRVEVVARFSPRSKARVGDSVHIAVDTARLHAFDLNTGRSIW